MVQVDGDSQIANRRLRGELGPLEVKGLDPKGEGITRTPKPNQIIL